MTSKVLYKIRKLRESKDLSQEYMADKLGINQSTYAKVESGAITLTTPRLEKIAAILGESVEYFWNKRENGQKGGPAVDLQGDQRKGTDWKDVYRHSQVAIFKAHEKALLRKEPNTEVEILEVAYFDQLEVFIYKITTDKANVVEYVPEYFLKELT